VKRATLDSLTTKPLIAKLPRCSGSRTSSIPIPLLFATQVIGGILLLMGYKAVPLHYLYGALPLIVGLIAEQLKMSAAMMILDARGLAGAQAVAALPAAEQREVVVAILRRETGSMTLAALVVTALLFRAATVVH
jgi:hypothetical protein